MVDTTYGSNRYTWWWKFCSGTGLRRRCGGEGSGQAIAGEVRIREREGGEDGGGCCSGEKAGVSAVVVAVEEFHEAGVGEEEYGGG